MCYSHLFLGSDIKGIDFEISLHLLAKCDGQCVVVGLGGLTPLGKIFYLSFTSEGHGQGLEDIGSIGRIQIAVGFWIADWQYL